MNCPTLAELRAALLEYERLHAAWMESSVFNEEQSVGARAAMELAGARYDVLSLRWARARQLAGRPLMRDIPLSSGRVVRHARMANGAQSATPEPGPAEMTHAEWLEYCSLIRCVVGGAK